MIFFPKCPCLYVLGQFAFYYFLCILQRFCMHFSFLSGAPHFLLFSIICRALSCATLFQLISKQSAVSACAKLFPMSEVWPTWRLSAGNLFYYLRPFHYLNHPPTHQLLLSLSLNCTPSPMPASSGLWLVLCFFFFFFLHVGGRGIAVPTGPPF